MTCSRNVADLKVLLVGLLCTFLIYSGVNAFEEVMAASVFQVDLVLHK